MWQKSLVFILLCCLSNLCVTYAQEDTTQVKLWTIYPGYVITLDDDTVHGYLLLKNKISNQEKVFFFDSEDAEEPIAKYKPKDIRAYKVANRNYKTLKFSAEYTTAKYHFFLKEIDGPISMYCWYYDDKERVKIDEDDIWNSTIDFSFNENELSIQKIGVKFGGEPVDFGDLKFLLKFKKSMSEYVSDYSGLSQKIANKQEGYKYIDLEKVIKEYNFWYQEKNK